MSISLGNLYKDDSSDNVYWCDNYNGPAVLRLIENADVLNGVFNGTINPITNPQSQPQGTNLINGSVLVKADDGSPNVYLNDNYDGTWKKRFILNMDVFHSRNFKESYIQTQRASVLAGMANGIQIGS